MDKILKLVVTNSLTFAFPIKFNLKEFKRLKPEYRGNSKSEFLEYLLTNVFENPSLFAKEVQKLDHKLKSHISVESLYKKFIDSDNLPKLNTFWLSENYEISKFINIHDIKIWEGKKFFNDSNIEFKSFEFIEDPETPNPWIWTENEDLPSIEKFCSLIYRFQETISYPIYIDSDSLSKITPPFNGSTFEDFKEYFRLNIDDIFSQWDYLAEIHLSDWFESNSKILGEKFINSVKEFSGVDTRYELDRSNIIYHHCIDYNTVNLDLIEDKKSNDFGNWNFNQFELF
ncbi:MAG: hypothetical protein ACON5K_02590 [Bacteroidia bacterium]